MSALTKIPFGKLSPEGIQTLDRYRENAPCPCESKLKFKKCCQGDFQNWKRAEEKRAGVPFGELLRIIKWKKQNAN